MLMKKKKNAMVPVNTHRPELERDHIGIDRRAAGVGDEAGEARGHREEGTGPAWRRRAVGPGREHQPLRQEQQGEAAHDAGHDLGLQHLEQQGAGHDAEQAEGQQEFQQFAIEIVAERRHAQQVHHQQHRHQDRRRLRHRDRQRHHRHGQ
jgi:hypothetical protein